MRIIISPAKKMQCRDNIYRDMPLFIDKAGQILSRLRELSYEELRALWNCSDAIAGPCAEELAGIDLRHPGTPAILAYDGIQYQYMAPQVMTDPMMDYLSRNLRILSGLYGMLRPMDGVVSYRLEMQAKLAIGQARNLYQFWSDAIYRAVMPEDHTILNLASREYSQAVSPYLMPGERMVTCVFGEREKGKVVQKGVYAKMARGEMVRFLAETGAETPEEAKAFTRLHYHFEESLSDQNQYVFLREVCEEKKRPEFEWE